MKLFEFDYNKDGDKTKRSVLLLNKSKDYFDTIDFGHLEDHEIEELQRIYTEYEEQVAPFMKKAFRRFSKEKMENLRESNSEV